MPQTCGTQPARGLEPDDPDSGITPRRSRAGPWRAAVLLLVHVVIALHIAHWYGTGSTLSPLEPSESMEFSKRGLINAGAIFFALTIVSTFVLGRFFCGWACHIVALQDACRWLLVKVGIRPRPVQLGVLGSVPWIVFVYMFIGPLIVRVYRELAGLEVATTQFKLSTNLFWSTFPGWPMAVLTFLVCGFVVVYFLGAKAFCTYGCPYGAIFGIADQLAPLRIRVTSACDGCGHCTSVCTSNVRVHQEVRDWKAVVDPGCMKCMDCVSVCPKDALYLGWGAPALWTSSSRATKPPPAPHRWASLALRGGFMWACFELLMFRGGEFELGAGFAQRRFIGGQTLDCLRALLSTDSAEVRAAALVGLLPLILALLGLAVAWVFAGKSQRRGGPTLGEEALIACSFLLGLYAFRGFALLPGVEEGVPLLLSIGLAGLVAWFALCLSRLGRGAPVAVQNAELLRDRKLTRAGWSFAALALPLAFLVGQGSWTRLAQDREHARRQRDSAEARVAYDRGVAQAGAGELEAATLSFEAAVRLRPDFLEALENLAGMYCAAQRYAEGIAQYEAALRLSPADPDTHFLLGQACAESGDLTSAERHWNDAVRFAPDHPGAREQLALLCEARGDREGARKHREAARSPKTPPTH